MGVVGAWVDPDIREMPGRHVVSSSDPGIFRDDSRRAARAKSCLNRVLHMIHPNRDHNLLKFKAGKNPERADDDDRECCSGLLVNSAAATSGHERRMNTQE